jgi:hypothetical protein
MLMTRGRALDARRRVSMARKMDNGNPPKPEWRAPEVNDLGNLRDFVRMSSLHVKSGPSSDGDGGSEKKAHDD